MFIGEIVDVAVDVRPGSATYGQHFSVNIKGGENKAFWIPSGFLHGFQVSRSATKETGTFSKSILECKTLPTKKP